MQAQLNDLCPIFRFFPLAFVQVAENWLQKVLMPAESVVIRRRTRPVHVDGFITVNSQEAKDAPDGSKDWRQVRRPAAYSAESKNAWIQISKVCSDLAIFALMYMLLMLFVDSPLCYVFLFSAAVRC